MPKCQLTKDHAEIETKLIDAMTRGLRMYRPDLTYPESYSDMQGCARGVMVFFFGEQLKYKE